MDYTNHVKDYLKKVKDQKQKDLVIALYNYLTRGFPYELAIAERDYTLGLSDDSHRHKILVKAYHKENELRSHLGLEPLPPIDLTIL